MWSSAYTELYSKTIEIWPQKPWTWRSLVFLKGYIHGLYTVCTLNVFQKSPLNSHCSLQSCKLTAASGNVPLSLISWPLPLPPPLPPLPHSLHVAVGDRKAAFGNGSAAFLESRRLSEFWWLEVPNGLPEAPEWTRIPNFISLGT